MKKLLLCMIFTLLSSQVLAQVDVDPSTASKKAQEDAWAAATKAKAADDAAVAALRAAEAAKKTPPETPLEVHIYGGKGGAISK